MIKQLGFKVVLALAIWFVLIALAALLGFL